MISRSDAAAQIKSCLNIQEVAERYGMHFDTRGRALCMFHDDRHPSGSIKNNRYHCFVCDLHLDVFDFTMRLFNISFAQAILRLNGDFGLGLCGQKPDNQTLERFRHEQEDKAATLAACRAEYDRNVEFYTDTHGTRSDGQTNLERGGTSGGGPIGWLSWNI